MRIAVGAAFLATCSYVVSISSHAARACALVAASLCQSPGEFFNDRLHLDQRRCTKSTLLRYTVSIAWGCAVPVLVS